jgi:hypothetical protein
MAKRDTDTEIWNEDWFIKLSDSEMLFWFFIKDQCDGAGFWRPNLLLFEKLTGRRINVAAFLGRINEGKERIKVLSNGRWFLTGFIAFHHNGWLNTRNHNHQAIYDIFRANLPDDNPKTYGFEVCGERVAPAPRPRSGRPIDERHIIPPTLDMVSRYCEERNNGIDPQMFIDHYATRNWIPKGSSRRMADWQAAVHTWEKFKNQRQRERPETQREILSRLEREGRIPRRMP